jgi:hypothetical protein
MASMPFFNRKEVVALLDRLPKMETAERAANDQVLMLLASMSVLQERYIPSAAGGTLPA